MITPLLTLTGILASEWIAGTYVPPAETNTAAFFKEAPNDVLEKRFSVRNVAIAKANWKVAAPGMRDLSVNGKLITATALPPWTPYDHRVLEESFDVTDQIVSGETNRLRVELGNGWFNPLPLDFWYTYNLRNALATGTPCVKATLEINYVDGGRDEIKTDASWRSASGRVLKNSIYLGVREDLRRELDFSQAARVVEGPRGKMFPAGGFPKTIIYDRWRAKAVTPVTNGVWLVDMGVNYAGSFRAKLHNVTEGQIVRFRKGERKHPDGSVNVMSAVAGQIKNPSRGPFFGIAEERDTIVCRAASELTYEPRFAYHVFRYIQVEGLETAPRPEDFEALAWSAEVKERSSFVCSNAKLNRLHEVCRRTFRSNLQSVQSDCPGREKFGYGGDMACTADAFWCNYDMHEFYRKAVRDFIDEAAEDGWITETAPYVGIASNPVVPRKAVTSRGAAPMGWAVGLPVLLDTLVRYAGDLDIVREAYPTLVRYLEQVRARYPNNDIPICLGDWIPPEKAEKADMVMSSLAHWHQFVALTAKFARLLGKSEDAGKYAALADEVAKCFRARHLHGAIVSKGSQGDQLFGLYHGLIAPSEMPAAYARLKADIVRRGNSLTTGIFATKYLLEYLSCMGDVELAGRVVTHEGYPGWYHMLDNGATTLWEHWLEEEGRDGHSNCHPMFGSVDEWMIRHLLGISVLPDAIGCNRVRISPKAVAGVTSASGWFDTPKGRITVAWKLSGGKLVIDKKVPSGILVVE